MKFVLACLVPLIVHASESQDILDSMTPFEAADAFGTDRAVLYKQIHLLEQDARYLRRDTLANREGRQRQSHPICLDATLEIDFRPEKFMRVLTSLREKLIRDFEEFNVDSKNLDMLSLTRKIRFLASSEADFLRTIYGQLSDPREQHFLTYLFGLDDDRYMLSGSEMSEASRRGRLLLQTYVETARQHVQVLAEESLRVVQNSSYSEIPKIKDQIEKWEFHLSTMTYHIDRGVTFAFTTHQGKLETTLAQLGKGLNQSLRRAEQEFRFRRYGEAFADAKLSGVDLNDDSAPKAVFNIGHVYNGGRHAFANLESIFQSHRDVLILQYTLTAGLLIGRSAVVPNQSRGPLRIGRQTQKTLVPLSESVEDKLWRIFFAEVGDFTGDSLGLCQGLLADQRLGAIAR